MTNVLLAIAIVLFACLLGFGVFCIFIYRYEKEQEKWDDRTDEIKAELGSYHKINEIKSLHPSPFKNYSFTGYTDSFYQKMKKNKKESLEKRVEELEAKIEDISIFDGLSENYETFTDKLEELDRRVKEIDRDLNGISGLKFDVDVLNGHYTSLAAFSHQIMGKKINNLIEDITYIKTDYEKRFESIAESLNDIREESEEK